jgi:hypothetical protein
MAQARLKIVQRLGPFAQAMLPEQQQEQRLKRPRYDPFRVGDPLVLGPCAKRYEDRSSLLGYTESRIAAAKHFGHEFMMNMRSHDQFDTPLATRAAGLERLQAFLPKAGANYAHWRNHDFGPGRHDHVSGLSPYIRHRLITEEEVIRAVLTHHSAQAAEKFIQEVYWRTYWKGWLELRPAIWDDYLADLERLGPPYGDALDAMKGQTGIACFDHWAQELVTTGYLHNHARMWFASIWIFTLGLPWQQGADFFLQHLLDGDPASNTLSWRWVAGLQTPGKTYLATPENIAAFTGGRFTPKPLPHGPAPALEPIPAPRLLPPAFNAPEVPFLLLVTEEDLQTESLPLKPGHVAAIAGLAPRTANISPRVATFRSAALVDGMARAATHFGHVGTVMEANALVDQAKGLGLNHIVTAYAPIGPTATQLGTLAQACAAQGVELHLIRRAWDSAAWPLATKGFFPFRQHIPNLLPR